MRSPCPTGPFARTDHPWEPLPAGAQLGACADSIRNAIPHSVDNVSPQCQGGFCDNIVRLDSDVFHDEKTNRWWLSYAWYTNTPPMVAWEKTNYGEHTSIVELKPSDPFAVICDPNVKKVFAADCHDANLLGALNSSCLRCGETLSFTRDRQNNEFIRDGFSWGVVEGPNLFRHGDLIYLMLSGSIWDSGYYSLFYLAAPTVEELAMDNPKRIAGRFVIPSLNQAFGHGTAVIGPDGQSLYFVHHRLRHDLCQANGDCHRDVFVSPIDFEDRHDGKGPIWIKPRFPAEDPTVTVQIPN